MMSMTPTKHCQTVAYTPFFFKAVLSLTLLLLGASQTWAQERNLYVGVTTAISDVAGTWFKTVDNTLSNSLVTGARRGQWSTKDSAEDLGLEVGLLVGYRFPLGLNDTYLSVEVDAAADLNEVSGQLPGRGTSNNATQLGEAWPDGFDVEGERNYGITLKLSHQPGILRPLGVNLYVLAGMRRYEGEFRNHFVGCFSVVECSNDAGTPNFESGSDSRKLTNDGYSLGIGIGKEFMMNTSIRVEARVTQYDDQMWTVPFQELGVQVFNDLETRYLSVGIAVTRNLF